MIDLPDYPFHVRALDAEEGGGYPIAFPDLPGCMSDGQTIEEAIGNGRDAVQSWIATAREFGDPIPEPSKPDLAGYSGKWLQRVPKSLHRKLADRAKAEGVSLNALVTAILAEGLGERRGSGRDA